MAWVPNSVMRTDVYFPAVPIKRSFCWRAKCHCHLVQNRLFCNTCLATRAEPSLLRCASYLSAQVQQEISELVQVLAVSLFDKDVPDLLEGL